MDRQLTFVLAAGLSLSGCCHDGVWYPISHSMTQQQQLRPIAKPHHQKRSKPAIASNSLVTFKDFPASEDEFSQSAADELKKKLVICRGCEDQIGRAHV